MPIKTTLNYSPNFDPKKRQKKSIKFLIFHYTGMRKESDSINRLTDFQSEVASHYLIKRNGEILKQGLNKPMKVEEQIAIIYCGGNGLLNDVPVRIPQPLPKKISSKYHQS